MAALPPTLLNCGDIAHDAPKLIGEQVAKWKQCDDAEQHAEDIEALPLVGGRCGGQRKHTGGCDADKEGEARTEEEGDEAAVVALADAHAEEDAVVVHHADHAAAVRAIARAPPSEAPSEGKSQDALRLHLARRRHVGCDLAPSRGPSSRRRGRPAPRRVQSLDRS